MRAQAFLGFLGDGGKREISKASKRRSVRWKTEGSEWRSEWRLVWGWLMSPVVLEDRQMEVKGRVLDSKDRG